MMLPSPRLYTIAALSIWFGCASCGGGGSTSPTPAVNRAPAFTSAATASAAENTNGTFYTATASDADGDPITYSISGGVDSGALRVSANGALSFASPPDFEAPTDADRNNSYLVQLSVSDGKASTTIDLTVSVTNLTDGNFRVRRAATGFVQPLYLTAVPDGSGRVFVVEQGGRIRILSQATGAIAPTPFLDISSTISSGGERGLGLTPMAPTA